MDASHFGWVQVARVGLVQAALGAVVVLTTSTLNRVMVVEQAMPALLPGLLLGLHHGLQVTRPRMGHGTDTGARHTPWILGGMAVLALGAVLAALATVLLRPHAWLPGLPLAILGFTCIGLGVSACGTSLLALLARRVPDGRQAGAATMVWVMMIAGFIVTAAVAGRLLEPYSADRLVAVACGVCASALALACLAMWGLEGSTPLRPLQQHRGGPVPASGLAAAPAAVVSQAGGGQAEASAFRPALAAVWADPVARRFSVFVFLSMLAYSAQDLILEPFAGAVLGYTPGESTALSGLQHGGALTGMLLAALAGRHGRGRVLGSLRAWTIGGCLASALAMAGLVVAAQVGQAWPFRANVFLLGVANGCFSIAAIATMMQLAVRGQGAGGPGVRMGLWGAAQALAFGLGGLLGTGASDLARWWLGAADLAYAGVFALEAVMFLMAAAVVGRDRDAAQNPVQASAQHGPSGQVFNAAPSQAAAPERPKLSALANRSTMPHTTAAPLASGVPAALLAVPQPEWPPRADDPAALAAQVFDVVVVGGGPAGATAAHDAALAGLRVLVVERDGRIKPCGGAIPPRLQRDFDVPDSLLVARARTARMVSPRGQVVDMPIDGGAVGLVDRETFDEWLRQRAQAAGAQRLRADFLRLEDSAVDRQGERLVVVRARSAPGQPVQPELRLRARCIVGADGARSEVARQAVPGATCGRWVTAYHEIVRSPAPGAGHDPQRCDIHYRGSISPDFYGWVFPHGATTSVGTGSAKKGFSLRQAVGELRAATGLAEAETLRREGAPLPLKPLPRWDDGRHVVLAGDAAGVVAPASGEGIYYAMLGGRLAAQACVERLSQNDVRALARPRQRFLREHGRVFWVLGMMQAVWYRNDALRERFVSICRDPDVQRLTFESYMHKRLVRHEPLAHVRIFFKDLAHLLGLARV